jgi:NRPS condensation-like uncharacterized protein
VRLYLLEPDRQVLQIRLHHIICDGWSVGILLREWNQIYRAFR